MKPRDIFLAMVPPAIWGFSFVAIKIGLQDFSAPQLSALRFLIAALPVFFLPRPALSWSMLATISATLFAGQFLLLFFAFKFGLPGGLASVTQQSQVFFTILLAAIFLGDIPHLRQYAGMAIAAAGMILIGLTVGSDLTAMGLILAIAAAFSWAIGNILLKYVKDAPILSVVVWCSLLAPIPSVFISTFDAAPSMMQAMTHATWQGLASIVYLGTFGTIGTYWIWGSLLRRYPTATVAPFALLVPCTGILSTALVFGERFGPLRYAGMGLILAGLAVIVLPIGKSRIEPPEIV